MLSSRTVNAGCAARAGPRASDARRHRRRTSMQCASAPPVAPSADDKDLKVSGAGLGGRGPATLW